MEGGDFHLYRDCKLVRLRIGFEMADVMRQLGALPQARSRGERLAMRAVRGQGNTAARLKPHVGRWRARRPGSLESPPSAR